MMHACESSCAGICRIAASAPRSRPRRSSPGSRHPTETGATALPGGHHRPRQANGARAGSSRGECTTGWISAHRRHGALKAAPVVLAGDDPQQHRAESLYRRRPGLPIGVGDPGALRFGQLSLEFSSFRRQLEEALPPILRARPLENEPLPYELTKDAAQALFGDAQYAKQLADRHLGVASDEVDDAMMGPSKTVLHEYRIGLRGEVTI